MWKSDASWKAIAAHISSIYFPPGNIDQADDTRLKEAFGLLKTKNIALGLEAPMLSRSDACRANTEAHAAPGALTRILEKVRRNGGELRYILMDEPFYWGHRDTSGCEQTAAELANNVAENIRSVRRIFPNVEIGDVEVVDASSEWITDLLHWNDAYQAAVGEPLAFFQADIAWSVLAMQNLVTLSRQLRGQIPFGIIYNAGPNVANDEQWQLSTERNISEAESMRRIHPDIAVFATWEHYPTRLLPEDRFGTMTNIVLRYLRSLSLISLSRDGNAIIGKLNDASDSPLANKTIRLSAVDVNARGGPTVRKGSGVVPLAAVSGVIGVRVGTEGACVCAGGGTATLGTIEYSEQNGRQVAIQPTAGHPWETITLIPGRKVTENLRQIPVTPGASFTIASSIMATASAEHAGYVTIVFLDHNGKGIQRLPLWFGPSERDIGNVLTNMTGNFRLEVPEPVIFEQPEIRAWYPGDDTLGPAMAKLSVRNRN
jgi:hypothetical protein